MLPPEVAHNLSIWALKSNLIPAQRIYKHQKLEQKLFGLSFDNPVGLAAGFDKNAECIENLVEQNFGFLEFGTVTPVPQAGNDKPRIFRLKEYDAVINRMGFPNKGLELFSQKLRQWKYTGINSRKTIIGANIGKNKLTADISSDYISCMEKIYGLCDYITVNISSPNTPGLRELQKKDNLKQLLSDIKSKKKEISTKYKGNLPVLLKISPDESEESLADIADIVVKKKIDGVIISNTTINPELMNDVSSAGAVYTGGLSGRPVFGLSTEIIRKFYQMTEGKVPIIGVGGVFSAEDAYVKIKAGASLVQLYTGLVYKGFGLVNEINEGLVKLLVKDGFSNISEAVGRDVR